jgi:glycerol-3-phosphate O-acyltransferase
VLKEMGTQYDRIAARFNWRIIRLFDVVLRPLWTKVFSGVDVPEEDLDRIRTAMRDGTPVLIPCHKSHFDYILVTWVLYNHDMTVPHVVAGMNLAVWPISTVLRWCGGFFIERSFGDDRVFPAVFGRYLREMVRQEYPMEFFIEGGRTRSGKLMSPRLGVLGMVLDAAEVRPADREVTLLPIALAYEQVAEERVYAAELGGEPKRKESFGELLRARSVFKRRFGRVYLRVGEPVLASELVDGDGDRPAWSDRPEAEQKDTLERLGDRIVHRIGASMVLLPTSLVALAALAHHRRALSDQELRARIARFHAFLARRSLPMAASLDVVEQGVAQALDRFVSEGRLRSLEHDGERVWDVPPPQRITLDFYKNQVLHAFAEAGTVAAAIRAQPEGPFDAAVLHVAVAELRRVWRREFVWDPDADLITAVQRGLHDLVAHGAIAEEDGRYRVVDPVCIGEVHALFRPLLEAYLLVARRAAKTPGDQPRSAFVGRLQAEQDDLLVAGAVSRPESISKVNLQNAVGAFTDLGALTKTGGGDRKDPVLRADREALSAIADTLAPMVGA